MVYDMAQVLDVFAEEGALFKIKFNAAFLQETKNVVYV